MTPLKQRLMDNLQVRLPGALAGVIQLELFNVMGALFEQSSCWKEDVTFKVKSGVATYEIAPSAGVITRLDALVDANDFSVPASMAVPGVIDLLLTPAADTTYTATMILSVDPGGVDKEGIPDAPDWVFQKYQLGLQDGVLAAMMSQPAKPYSNLNLARVHLVRFNTTVSKARYEAQHGNLQRGQAWSFPQGWTSRKRR